MEIEIKEEKGKPPVILFKPKEKTAEEILEGLEGPEYMGCAEWLQKERPDYSEKKLSSHPLFSSLKEAMQLADFEVDTIEGFLHKYMETDMPEEQAETMMILRQNSMYAKNVVTQLIDLLLDKTTIEAFTQNYFLTRLEFVLQFQSDLLARSTTLPGLKNATRKSLKNTTDSRYTEVEAGFLRSYNTKNKIMRDLLYSLREQNPAPLASRLPHELLALLRLSPSLHPFLNKEDETWVNYEDALRMGEVRNFLGNAKELKINVQNCLKENKIRDFKIPKVFQPLSALPLPSFVLEGKKKETLPTTVSTTKKKQKRKKNTKRVIPTVPVDKPQEQPTVESPILTETSSKGEEMKPVIETSSPTPGLSIPLKKETPQPTPAKKGEDVKIVQTPKVANAHIDTILDIFRSNGYKNLSDNKIISAWEYVLDGKGYHKKETGRSHQPLYATLSDGSRVVLGLFRSSGYGPRYVKYIRDAFDKIGFGRTWLESQGYILD